ncbi:hypothetical protein SARC_15662, partial [Sphaeroforma arctica JP610]
VKSGDHTFYLNPCRGVVHSREKCPTSAPDNTGVCRTSSGSGEISSSDDGINSPVSYGTNDNGAIVWNDGLVTMAFGECVLH